MNNPIDLLGAKSEAEHLLALLEKVTGLSIEFDDGFPKKICRSCYNRVKQFPEFKDLCLKSRKEQESLGRFKRGKKSAESPSATDERQQKRGKQDETEPRARQCLQSQFLSECKEGGSQEQLPDNAVRSLPEFLQPTPVVQPSKGVLILAKSGLRNSKVCKLS